ncbi:MAG: flagellar biosynthetic protein FliR [Lachnospiraceae bacterium]|nr:flagellar biosynthetic protein FliR [Lachnospiraceae bacterium]
MIDVAFPIEELEFYLLILVRVSCFVFAAPFFSQNGVPRPVKVTFSIFTAYLLYSATLVHEMPEYSTLFQYAGIVIKEAVTGLLVGLGAQFCFMIISFAGHMVDTEIGFAMASLMDPTTRQQTTVTGMYLQYAFMLIFLLGGMYRYLLSALAETFILIPVGQAQFFLNRLYDSFLTFMTDYIVIGFRICLPVFCTILIVNGLLGIMAKVSPQMNMFAVGLQIKVFAGLGVLLLTTSLLPTAADFIFVQMKRVIVMFVKAMGAVYG